MNKLKEYLIDAYYFLNDFFEYCIDNHILF